MTLTCSAIASTGSPCRAHAGKGGYCWAHDPSLEGRERHRQASRRGGLKGIAPLPAVGPAGIIDSTELETLAGLRRLLAGTLAQLSQIPVDARVATATGQLATAQRNLIEGSDIEDRLTKLESGAPGLKLHKNA